MEIATSPAMVSAFPEGPVPETISPELVLVDPELRRAFLTGELEQPALWVVPDEKPPVQAVEPEPQPPLTTPNLVRFEPLPVPTSTPLPLPPREAVEPEPRGAPARARARVALILLPLSLAINAILIAVIVSDLRNPQASTAPPSLTSALPSGGPSKQQPPPKAKPARQRSDARSKTAPRSTKPNHDRSVKAPAVDARTVAVERKLLNLVIQSPSGKLPRALIDPRTGLAKNNLQAVCRRESGRRSYLCVVQPAQHKPGEGAYVRYRLNRSGSGGTFAWSRYRHG